MGNRFVAAAADERIVSPGVNQARPGKWLVDAEQALSPGKRVIIAVLSASIFLAGIGSVLAWRSYTERVGREQDHLSDAADDAAMSLSQFFSGRTAMLHAVASIPGVGQGDLDRIRQLLGAVGIDTVGFTGGVGWADSEGMLQVSSAADPPDLPIDLSDRAFIRHVLETGSSSVGDVVMARATDDYVAQIAVPTFSDGRTTGVLLGSVVLDGFGQRLPALTPDRYQIRVVDRPGRVILSDGKTAALYRPTNPSLLDGPTITRGVGLMGNSGRVIGLASVPETGWTVVVEQDQQTLMAGARARLVGEVAALLLLGLVTVGAARVAARRTDLSHSQVLVVARNLEALESLSEKLSAAPSTGDVAEAVLNVFGHVFDAESVAVGLAQTDGSLDIHAMANPLDAEVAGDTVSPEAAAILAEAFSSAEALVLSVDELRQGHPGFDPSSQVTGLLAGRFVGRNARGAVFLTVRGPFPPKVSDVELFAAMVPLLGDAFGRAAAAESQRLASKVFQQALLPRDTIGSEVNLQRAVRYIAAVGDAEVGGDWYDLWMLDSDHVGAVVGDVVGRGVVAAAAMGQLRSTLRATAALAGSPGQALTQLDEMSSQIPGSPSATVLVTTFDLRGSTFSLASAGHLPPLLATATSVRAMYEVKGAPIGFLRQRMTRVTMTVELAEEDTLVLYTDGLVERRGESIDEGIERLRRALADNHRLGVEALADVLLECCLESENDDDVALMILRPVRENPVNYTAVAPIDDFDEILEGVAAWMRDNQYPRDARKVVLGRVEDALEVVLRSTADDPVGDLVVEVMPGDAGDLRLALEYRRGAFGAGVEDQVNRLILRRWGYGEMGLGGPRLRFSVAGMSSTEN